MHTLRVIWNKLSKASGQLWRRSKILWLLGLSLFLCFCCFGFGFFYSLTPGYRASTSATVAAFRSTQDTASRKQTELLSITPSAVPTRPALTSVPPSVTSQPIPPTATRPPTNPPTSIRTEPTLTTIPPTPSPAPTRTAPPPTVSVPSAKGLGISRVQLQTLFEAFDFLFEQGAPVNGADNYTARNKNVLLQLVGPADALTQVSLVAVADEEDSLNNAKAAVYMVLLLRAMQPGWDEAGEMWLTDAIKRAGTGETVTLTRNQMLIRVSGAQTIGTIVITFEPVS